MTALVSIRFDTTDFSAWSTKVVAQLGNAIAGGINVGSTAARRAAIDTETKDSQIPRSALRGTLNDVTRARAGSLVNTWRPPKDRSMIRGSGGARFAPGLKGPLTGSTFVVTGGGSSSLTLARGFTMTGRSGNVLVVERTGKGRHASLKGAKIIYAESPKQAIKQASSAPTKDWQKTAERALGEQIAARVARVLSGATVAVDDGGNA